MEAVLRGGGVGCGGWGKRLPKSIGGNSEYWSPRRENPHLPREESCLLHLFGGGKRNAEEQGAEGKKY